MYTIRLRSNPVYMNYIHIESTHTRDTQDLSQGCSNSSTKTAHTEIDHQSGKFKPNLDRNYLFTIDLAPNDLLLNQSENGNYNPALV